MLKDVAHVLRPISGVGKFGDFITYGPHKLLPVPDGAVLKIQPSGPPGQFNSEKLQNFAPNTAQAKDLSSLDTLKRVPVRNSFGYYSSWLF